MRWRTLAACVIPVMALAGCSQINALTPVGGDSITTVRNAVYDVLVKEGVEILVAPQCTTEAQEFVCTGSTLDGSVIRAVAETTAPYPMTLDVADQNLFTGNASDVLDAALREAS